MLARSDFRPVRKKPDQSDEGEVIYYEKSTWFAFSKIDEVNYRFLGKLMIIYDLDNYIIPVIAAR